MPLGFTSISNKHPMPPPPSIGDLELEAWKNGFRKHGSFVRTHMYSRCDRVGTGERLCSSEQCACGIGTYERHGYIFASLTGMVSKEVKKDGSNSIWVKSKNKAQSIPEVGAVVTCKITTITSRFAKCQISAVNNCSLSQSFRGMIRKEDVRATDRDRVEIFKSFRPGDIVLAKVLSLGDAMCYLLTTAENELGVVVAESEAGQPMIPLSHSEMQCPTTLLKENRKVARPQAEHLAFLDR